MAVPLTLPYAHLNLRRNPFGELERAERAELAEVEVDELVECVRRPGVAVQLLGGSGCGKTTHLLAIHRRFASAPYVKVIDGTRARVPFGHPVHVDDAHLLASSERRRLLHRPASFVLTTQCDLSEEIARSGLRSVVVRPHQLLSADLLERVFARRVEAARRGPGPVPRLARSTVEALIERWGPDVRSMERALYEALARLEECGYVRVPT
ncbi:MAG: hypothetical protein AB1714_10080 [Acidobacteriota bacterium]